jgi:hypothetical protein
VLNPPVRVEEFRAHRSDSVEVQPLDEPREPPLLSDDDVVVKKQEGIAASPRPAGITGSLEVERFSSPIELKELDTRFVESLLERHP